MNLIYLVVSGSWWQLSQQIAHTQQETATVVRAAPPTSQENTIAPSGFLEKGLRALVIDKHPL